MTERAIVVIVAIGTGKPLAGPASAAARAPQPLGELEVAHFAQQRPAATHRAVAAHPGRGSGRAIVDLLDQRQQTLGVRAQ